MRPIYPGKIWRVRIRQAVHDPSPNPILTGSLNFFPVMENRDILRRIIEIYGRTREKHARMLTTADNSGLLPPKPPPPALAALARRNPFIINMPAILPVITYGPPRFGMCHNFHRAARVARFSARSLTIWFIWGRVTKTSRKNLLCRKINAIFCRQGENQSVESSHMNIYLRVFSPLERFPTV